MHKQRAGRSGYAHVGQAAQRPRPRNYFWRILFVAAAFLFLLVLLALSAWILSELLKLRSDGGKLKKALPGVCPDVTCPDPCPNVTLVCPEIPDIRESRLCNDWDECTLDLLTTFDNETRACKHLVRENGFPCQSQCFASNQTSCHKGVCTGETCLGACEEQCPPLNGTFDSTECIDGACVYTKIILGGGDVVDCGSDVFQSTCEALIEDEPLRDCLVTDVVCGEINVRKRQGNFFVLCTYSFFCAPPRGIPLFP